MTELYYYLAWQSREEQSFRDIWNLSKPKKRKTKQKKHENKQKQNVIENISNREIVLIKSLIFTITKHVEKRFSIAYEKTNREQHTT